MTDELGSLSAPVPKAGTGAQPGRFLDADRLDELETFSIDDDTPDGARVSLPARDLRDLVRLIPCLRAANELRDAVSKHVLTACVLDALRRFDAARLGVHEPDRV